MPSAANPTSRSAGFNDNRFHLVPVDYSRPLQTDYLPATLTSKDYPNLIAEGDKVDTIAVPAVLAAYNWAPNTDRYRKLALFVDAFFTKFPTFQNPPFHPKWKEVSLSTPLPDWQRLPVAEQWLKSHNVEAVTRNRFDEFLKQSPATAANVKIGRRQGNPVQAIPGLGSRARREGAGSPASAALEKRIKSKIQSPVPIHIGTGLFAIQSVASAVSIPRFSAARAASRCSCVMWPATMRRAVARTAASSVKPSNGSMSGMKSNGRMK